MATTKIEPVVRRARASKRARRSVSHGNWKLVYADFVTVLMAFFIVVWILLFDLVSEREKFDKTCLTPLNAALQKQINEDLVLQAGTNPLQIEYSEEGLKVTLLDTREPMFQRGGTSLSDFAKKQFQKIASVVDMCPTHKLKIEGCTDSMPYSGGATGYGNWELSGERANAARRELIAQNVSVDRIAQVIGYGDSVPTLPDDPTNAINRRISITILPPLKPKGDLMMNDKK
jgi:flagellar motor protein MotB